MPSTPNVPRLERVKTDVWKRLPGPITPTRSAYPVVVAPVAPVTPPITPPRAPWPYFFFPNTPPRPVTLPLPPFTPTPSPLSRSITLDTVSTVATVEIPSSEASDDLHESRSSDFADSSSEMMIDTEPIDNLFGHELASSEVPSAPALPDSLPQIAAPAEACPDCGTPYEDTQTSVVTQTPIVPQTPSQLSPPRLTRTSSKSWSRTTPSLSRFVSLSSIPRTNRPKRRVNPPSPSPLRKRAAMTIMQKKYMTRNAVKNAPKYGEAKSSGKYTRLIRTGSSMWERGVDSLRGVRSGRISK